MRPSLRVYTIGAEFKKSGTRTSVAVPESGRHIRSERDIDTNCEHSRRYRSAHVRMSKKGPRETNQGYQHIGNERQTTRKPSSALLLACLRGGGTVEEAHEEYHPRYITLGAF